MNTYFIVLILTFLNTLIALLGFPFPFWFERWFIVISGIIIISLLVRKSIQKSIKMTKQIKEETAYEEKNETV